ncbi:MAG: QueT transporter family protein [Clostridia bacterium]|nr:QueT transporter family protein [Clostridia bacterium]
MNTTTKKLCRAGVIAALYVALTYAFAPVAFGSFQLRPAEALCILPLFFPESIPALTIGCALSNVASPFALYDILFGSLTTFLAAVCTYFIGKTVKKDLLKTVLGGLPPILFNALFIPIIIVLLSGVEKSGLWALYFSSFGSILLTQTVFVYGLGIPLYFLLIKLKKRNLRFLE